MNIIKSTLLYEQWLGTKLPLIDEDMEEKHRQMSKSLFGFMRATFYRWMQLWPDVCPDLADATEVLAVGDLHTDNFGSWRDVEGRLVWGINDFDEACQVAYTTDLVRLAVSAALALTENYGWETKQLCDAVVDGYSYGVTSSAEPFVLAEEHDWLKGLIEQELKEPDVFWDKLGSLAPVPANSLPREATAALDTALPEHDISYRTLRRVAGLGSLGRRRFVALFDFCSSPSARETKELTASAAAWSAGDESSVEIFYTQILAKAVRCRDPFLQVHKNWVVRRLSPDYTRLDLVDLPDDKVLSVLFAMGQETANVHLGSNSAAKKIWKDLKGRKERWLEKAVDAMMDALAEDWEFWRQEQEN